MERAESSYLQKLACQVRMGVIESVFCAQSGHPGGALSAAEIFTYLYFKELHIDPTNPKDPDRDRFVLSKGHTCPGLYSTLALRGFFSQAELKSFRKLGSILQGHPDMKGTPGVEMSTGSLGQGASAACGMALAGKIDHKGYRVYALLGDGELEEGQVWEASMFAAQQKLDNLCFIVDSNGLQIDGPVAEIGGVEPIDRKFAAFGFDVQIIDGHDFERIECAFQHAHEVKGKPSAIIAKTTKGKGVSFMENVVAWHGAAPNPEQYENAMQELRAAIPELELSQ